MHGTASLISMNQISRIPKQSGYHIKTAFSPSETPFTCAHRPSIMQPFSSILYKRRGVHVESTCDFFP